MSPVAKLLFAAALLTLIACDKSASQRSAPPAAGARSAIPEGPSLQKQLALYQQMVEADSPALAVPLGEDILRTAPDSAEAAIVRQTLQPLRDKAHQDGEEKRLARLWTYQGGSESGGEQQTASIYSTQAATSKDKPLRLVLRRHSAWGQSVYLYDNDNQGFRCGTPCRINVQFDEQPAQRYPANLPDTGEPALFIENDKAFIKAMEGARKLTFSVTMKDGVQREVVFEVAGFVADKWLPVARR